MDKENQLRLLRKAFSDISRGYSVVFLKGKRLFIKHLSHHEQVDLDVLYKSFLDIGIKEGLDTEKDKLKSLAEEEVWTDKDETELEEIKKVIERLAIGKKNIYLSSDLSRQNEEIKKEEQKYLKKKIERDRFLGLTAEAYAEKKINEHYIIESFYLDASFVNKFFTEESFEEVTDGGLQEMIRFYNEEIDVVSDRNIKHLSIQEFFQVYWSLSTEDLSSFFGRPICNLTYFQIKLGSYARMFKNILEKAENLPEDVRTDPEKLLDYVRTGENAKKRMEEAAQSGGKENDVVASTLIGAKNEEYKAIGMKSDAGAVSLTEELKRKQAEGKKGLDMHDLMRMLGA